MDEKEKRLFLLEKEEVKTALLKLGIPTMIGMLVSAFYNLVDAFFVGRLGTVQTAAVSVVYPLTMVGTGVGLLFGSGAGSYISRLLGKKEYEKVSICTSTTVFSGMIVIAAVVGVILFNFDPIMSLLGATNESRNDVNAYGMIYVASLIFNVFNVMVNNLLVAEGASSYSMGAMMSGGITNMLLDPVFIYGCSLGVRGAAVATLLSRLVSSGFYLFYLLKGNSNLKISFRLFKPAVSLYREIFKIGVPICFFQILSGGALSLTNVLARQFGEPAIAAMGIVNRVMSMEVNALYGFLKGYSTLTGYNYGSGNRERVKKATNTALLWSTGILFGLGLIGILFSGNIIYLFNQESPIVLEIGKKALRVDSISFLTLGLQIVIGNYFLAIGKAKQGGILSICRQGVFFIPFLFILSRAAGITGIIFAQPAADVFGTLLTLWIWKVYERSDKRRMERVKTAGA